ncbi:MAG: hypothetical protein HZB91_09005 [Elusimicrobia bacterium]|nr:hypothetical protein [Elusimicrobiota bacterium]
MKRIALALVALACAVVAVKAEETAAAPKPRCPGLNDLTAGIMIAEGRELKDALCVPEVWDYLEHQSGQKAEFERLRPMAGRQKQFLKGIVDKLEAVDKQEQAVEAAVKKLEEASKVVQNPGEQDPVKKKDAVQGLLDKEGAALHADFRDAKRVKLAADPKTLIGGKLYAAYVDEMFKLATADKLGDQENIVKKHLPKAFTGKGEMAADDWDYGKAVEKKSFNWWHMECLWWTDKSNCERKEVSERPAFCSIDRAQGARLEALFKRARAAVNAGAKVVGDTGKPLAEMVQGLDMRGQEKEKLALTDSFKKKIEGAQASWLDKAAKDAGVDPDKMGDLTAQVVGGGEVAKVVRTDAGGTKEFLEYVDKGGKVVARAEIPKNAAEVDAAFEGAAKTVEQSLSKDETLKGKLQAVKAAVKGEEATQKTGVGGSVDDPMGTAAAACDNPLETYNSEKESKIKEKAADRVKNRKDARGARDKEVEKLQIARDTALAGCDKAYRERLANHSMDAASGWGGAKDDLAAETKAANEALEACRRDARKTYGEGLEREDKALQAALKANAETLQKDEEQRAKDALKNDVSGQYDKFIKERLALRAPAIKSNPVLFFGEGNLPKTEARRKKVVEEYMTKRWSGDKPQAMDECRAYLRDVNGQRRDLEEGWDVFLKEDFVKTMVPENIRRQGILDPVLRRVTSRPSVPDDKPLDAAPTEYDENGEPVKKAQ